MAYEAKSVGFRFGLLQAPFFATSPSAAAVVTDWEIESLIPTLDLLQCNFSSEFPIISSSTTQKVQSFLIHNPRQTVLLAHDRRTAFQGDLEAPLIDLF